MAYRLMVVVVVLVATILVQAGCSEPPGREAFISPQNRIPHRNAISLQAGDRSDEVFQVDVHLGRAEYTLEPLPPLEPAIEPAAVFDQMLADADSPADLPYLLLNKVRRVTFTLEYWGGIMEFLLDWRPGTYFEQVMPDGTVNYAVSMPYQNDAGMTCIDVDISLDATGSSGRIFEIFQGNLISLMFRGIRNNEVPISFSTNFGQAFDGEGNQISGVSWYGGVVTVRSK